MLFCASFTQSERFLHTDQLITRLRRVEPATCCSHDGLHSHVVGKRDRERVQVRCSDLVGSDLRTVGTRSSWNLLENLKMGAASREGRSSELWNQGRRAADVLLIKRFGAAFASFFFQEEATRVGSSVDDFPERAARQ